MRERGDDSSGSSMMLELTPYPDINALLSDFASHFSDALTDQLIGLYLYGSLALGDFDPDHSDIDLIAVTDGALDDRQFEAIREMHARIAASDSVWAQRIEAAYIPREALNHPAPTAAKYPQIEKERPLMRDPLETGWPFQRYTLREHGIPIIGADPHTLIDPVDPDDMRQAVIAIAGGWLDQSQHDPDWLAWVSDPHAMEFVVLTLCRFLYSLATGKVASKPAAGRWAQAHDPRWHDLIERALTHRSHAADTDEMIALLTLTVQQAKGDLQQ